MINNPQSWIATLRKMKLTLVIKVLFVIWLSAYLVNAVSSSSVFYNTGSMGFKSFIYLLKQQSESVMTQSGVWLYFISLLWCILNYQKIKGYIQKKFEPKAVSKTDLELEKETTKKEWFGYACLFLASMLLVDTFLYESLTSFFKGNTQSQGMPKRVFFYLILIIFHKYRSVVLVIFLISVCVFVGLWLNERRQMSKKKVD